MVAEQPHPSTNISNEVATLSSLPAHDLAEQLQVANNLDAQVATLSDDIHIAAEDDKNSSNQGTFLVSKSLSFGWY